MAGFLVGLLTGVLTTLAAVLGPSLWRVLREAREVPPLARWLQRRWTTEELEGGKRPLPGKRASLDLPENEP